jgi:2-dehydro-3-deoxygluconokinase
MIRVACVGECMVELSLPAGDGDAARAPLPARLGFAGDAANVAIYLKRRAGAAMEVAFVSAVGDDALSRRMLAFLAAEGLDTGLVERREGRAPGLYAIALDARGERSFTYWREASAARTLFAPPCEVTPDRLRGFDLIYLSGVSLAVLGAEARAALRAFLADYRAGGGLVAFDSNYRPRLWPDAATARREIEALWRLTDVGLPSLDDEIALCGDADAAAVLARLEALGVRRGALKRGAAGPLAIGWDGAPPAFRAVARPRDTTAAGDSFNGGFLAALLAGGGPAACMAAGHALAARVVRHRGAIVPR